MRFSLPARLLLAQRNVFRHRTRTLATMAAISIGVAILIIVSGFIEDAFVQLAESTIHSQTGHIQVSKEGFRASRSREPATSMILEPERLKSMLRKEEGVQDVVARINFSGMVNNGKRDLGVIGDGVEPDGEARLGTFMRYVEGQPLQERDREGIVVGEGVARTLNLSIGDRVTLIISIAQGAVNTQDFNVVGVFQSFSREFDARAVRIPLSAARELLSTEAAHTLVLTLDDTRQTDRFADELRTKFSSEGIEATTWRQLSDFFEKAVELYSSQFGVLRLIILLMVLLSVTNSINMTLYERTREFGTLLALGDRPLRVFQLIMAESAVLGLLGASAGMTLGCLIAWIVSTIGIPMPPLPNSSIGYRAQIRLVPLEVLSAGAIGLGATVLAAVLPARRASRHVVVDALRHGA